METLPIEMVEMIVQQLTPQDLARCSAVCREWHEIFNQDWMWKPHCEPELEEPLRSVPSVATPAFVTPKVENSTLSPISHWKLAFMRETHLWKNWRNKEMMKYKEENVIKFESKGVDFLTDTLVVVWYSNRIEVYDVSVVPAAVVAQSNTFDMAIISYSVVGTTKLLVKKGRSVEVFNINNKTIELKHIITFCDRIYFAVGVKEHLYVCLDNERSKLKIFDLNTGKMLKEELCPVNVNQYDSVSFCYIRSCPTSDFVACQVLALKYSNDIGDRKVQYYVYDSKERTFLPGPVAEYQLPFREFALQGHWLATTDCKTLNVSNFQTQGVILSHKLDSRGVFIEHVVIRVCNDGFMFMIKFLNEDYERESSLSIYFPSHGTLITIYEGSGECKFKIFNNKLIAVFDYQIEISDNVWKLSGHMVEKCDIFVKSGCKVNRSFTRALIESHQYVFSIVSVLAELWKPKVFHVLPMY